MFCVCCAGCIDSGVGHEQFNKLLSSMYLPTIHPRSMKLAEDRVGKSIVAVAQDSCVAAIAEEKELTSSFQRFDYYDFFFISIPLYFLLWAATRL